MTRFATRQEMLPATARDNAVNKCQGDSVLLRHCDDQVMHPVAYLQNLRVRQFGVRAVLATSHSALGNFVLGVDGAITKKQVVWPYARRIVTVVQYALAFLNGTVRQFIGQDVRSQAVGTVAAPQPESTVAATAKQGSSPRPASVGALDLIPKTLNISFC